MESSGRFHIPLYYFFVEKGIQTFIFNPKIVHRFFEFVSTSNPSKHDKKDDKIFVAIFSVKIKIVAFFSLNLLQLIMWETEKKIKDNELKNFIFLSPRNQTSKRDFT